MLDSEYEKMLKYEEANWWFVGKRAMVRSLLSRANCARDDSDTSRVLDLGCGVGSLLPHLANYGSVVGTDASLVCLKMCRDKNDALLVQCEADKLPFSDRAFSLVMILDVLEHLEHDTEVLRHVREICRDDATLLVSVPAHHFLWTEHDKELGHYRRYSLRDVKDRFNAAGFELTRSSFGFSWLLPSMIALILWSRLSGNKRPIRTDFLDTPRWLNRWLTAMLRAEASLMSHFRLPFGTTLFAVGQPRVSDSSTEKCCVAISEDKANREELKSSLPTVSVIVPFLNGKTLPGCVASLSEAMQPDCEAIFVDDGSMDDSGDVVEAAGFKLCRQESTKGPAAARNTGAAVASGEILLFVDADVVVPPDVITKIQEVFALRQDVAAVHGNLSCQCPHRGFLSQYKNLYLHYTFNRAADSIPNFFTSVSAVRSGVFRKLCGFNESLTQPVVEDRELGTRLLHEGHKICFCPDIQVKHDKQYSLAQLVRTDYLRARDIARMCLEQVLFERKKWHCHIPVGLKASVLLMPLLLAFLCLSWWKPLCLAAVAVLLILILILNARFITFLSLQRGAWFGIRAAVFLLFDLVVFVAGMCVGVFQLITDLMLKGSKGLVFVRNKAVTSFAQGAENKKNLS